MARPIDLTKFKKALSHFTLLYVEKNEKLREKVCPFLAEIFATLYVASDSHEGLKLFHEHQPTFVITCVDLQDINGLQLAKKIREINPQTKIIITSYQEGKEYLLEAINLHVDGYLMKPFKMSSLAKLLHTLSKQILEEQNKEEFNRYIYKIFNKQQNLIALIRDAHIVLANETFLNFFVIKETSELKILLGTFDNILLPHHKFLYHLEGETLSCFEKIKKNLDKLYNVKILCPVKVEHHFILRLTKINEKQDVFILSLTDVTPLNLLNLYAKDGIKDEAVLSNEKTILHLFEAAKEADATIKLYNFYKGLMISSDSKILKTAENHYVVKTSTNQQKSVRFEQKTVIHCELFPYDIESDDIKDINFSKQTIDIGKCTMLKTTPSERKSLVLEPDERHSVSFVFQNTTYDQDIKIKDMSKEAIKIYLRILPKGLQKEDEIYISMSFNDGAKPTIIRAKAHVFKLMPHHEGFYIIADFAPTALTHKAIVDYLVSRQMTLVREFKSLSI